MITPRKFLNLKCAAVVVTLVIAASQRTSAQATDSSRDVLVRRLLRLIAENDSLRKLVDSLRPSRSTSGAAPERPAATAKNSACVEGTIMSPTPFMGNNGEIFKLADGSIWEVKFEYEYLYEYYPNVLVCGSRGKLYIKTKALNIQQVSAASNQPPATAPSTARQAPGDIESQIDGEFNGWEGETIFKLRNGQVWQQRSYSYHYKYAYAPKVLIYRSGAVYKMRVDGVDTEIAVRRIK
jgi:hypothetical protein